jgi:hypothetical protein
MAGVQFPGYPISRSKAMINTSKHGNAFAEFLGQILTGPLFDHMRSPRPTLKIDTNLDQRVTCLFLACDSDPRRGIFLDHRYLVTWTVVEGVTTCNVQFWERGHVRVFQGYTILHPFENVDFDILIGMRESARRACLGFDPAQTCEHLNILFAHLRTTLRNNGEAITQAYAAAKAKRHD